LLNNGPFAGTGDDEGVEVELEAVGNGVVIDTRGEAAGAGEGFTIEAGCMAEGEKFSGSFCGVAAATAANGEAEFRGARIQATF